MTDCFRERPLIVGEMNPYGGTDEYVLWPSPENSAGYRLCVLILGMYRKDYLNSFVRMNLCCGKWSIKSARSVATAVGSWRIILCGSRVCDAFGVAFRPFARESIPRLSGTSEVLVLPHPSGRNLMWNQPDSVTSARRGVLDLCPELTGVIGKADREEASP